MENEIREKYRSVIKKLTEKNISISTMESCTGGLIASLLTDIPGSSDVVRGGLVTYCNGAKVHYGVPADVIATHGVYSAQCAASMAEAVTVEFGTVMGIGITGSLCTVDKNNSDSVPGTVYAALKIGGRNPLVVTIAADEQERYLCKLTVADVIADMILDVCDTYE